MDESSYTLCLYGVGSPQGFIYEVLKVLDAMGVTSQEKAEFAAY